MRHAVGTLATATLTIMALTACSAPETETTSSPTPEVEAAAPPTATASTPAPSADEPVDAEEDCLVGEWLLDNESWLEATGSLYESDGATATIYGETRMTLQADGTVTQVYDEWTIRASQSGSTSTITRDGTDLGLWTLNGDVLELEDTEIGSSMIMVLDSPDGRYEMDMTLDIEDSAVQSLRTSCTAQTLTALTDEGTFDFIRQ